MAAVTNYHTLPWLKARETYVSLQLWRSEVRVSSTGLKSRCCQICAPSGDARENSFLDSLPLVASWVCDCITPTSATVVMFRFGNVCHSIFYFPESFLCPLHCKPIWDLFLISVFIFFSSKISFWSFYLLSLCWDFFICFKHVFNHLLKSFCQDYFKIFVI